VYRSALGGQPLQVFGQAGRGFRPRAGYRKYKPPFCSSLPVGSRRPAIAGIRAGRTRLSTASGV
ncbi:hypothetical protein C5706_33235, partial [Klebsiella pneumoniae]